MKIIFATGNNHKMFEIKNILGDLPYEILSMKEAGIECDIVEDADTFEGNALIKAREVAKICKEKGITDAIVMADDSGLEVDAMDKAPGVYSARFMGEDTPYDVKNTEIINRLDGKEGSDRSARFRCVIAAVWPDGREEISDGKVEGVIASSIMGANGFGYDPIFYVPKFGMTTAQMEPAQKDEISHRGNALRGIREFL